MTRNRRNKYWKRIVAIAIAFFVIFSMCGVITPVRAAGEDTSVETSENQKESLFAASATTDDQDTSAETEETVEDGSEDDAGTYEENEVEESKKDYIDFKDQTANDSETNTSQDSERN